MLRTGVRNPDAAVSGAGAEASCSRLADDPLDMDIELMYANLRQYLHMEHKFQPKLNLPTNPEGGEVSSGARDGAAHVLRGLKMWFDLPEDVLFYAINLFDRFLTKMKVRPCHVPCIAVSCLYLGVEALSPADRAARPVSIHDLVSVSQWACTAGDVARMSAVVRDKLGEGGAGAALVSPLCWLRLVRALARWAAARLRVLPHFDALIKESDLLSRLEMVACNAACSNVRPCELALVLLFNQLESQLLALQQAEAAAGREAPDDLYRLFDFSFELQRICQVSDSSLMKCHSLVRGVLERYEAAARSPHRQRLVWRLSSRTLKVLRPTDRLTSLLPTIQEQHLSPDSPPIRTRSGSESSDDLSEDTKDWPRSPVVPVYCDN